MVGRIRPNTFSTPNEHVDEAMEMLTPEEYKVLNFVVRHTWGWQVDYKAISLNTFTHGYSRYRGVGLSRATVIKCLGELSRMGFLVPVGTAEADGQIWSVGLDPDLQALEERYLTNKSKRQQQMSPVRAKRGRSDKAVYAVDQSTQQTDSGLSHRPLSVYGIDTIKDTSKDNSKDMSVASDDARAFVPVSQQNVSVEGIENVSQTDSTTDESLQKKTSRAEGRATKVRSPKQEANDAANAMLVQGIGEAWGVMAVPSDEKDYLMVARKLVAGTVPLAEFKWYTQYQTRDAKDNGYTIQTIWGLIAKGRISKYVKARNDYRAQQEAGTVKGAWSGGEAKGGAYYHKAVPLQSDSVPTGDVMALFAEEGQS